MIINLYFRKLLTRFQDSEHATVNEEILFIYIVELDDDKFKQNETWNNFRAWISMKLLYQYYILFVQNYLKKDPNVLRV